MSILRKKLDVKPKLPDVIKNTLTLWAPLQNSISTDFSELTQSSWEAGPADLKMGLLKELRSSLPGKGLCFGYGGDEDDAIFMAHFDVGFAARVTRRSLEIVSETTQVAYNPGMLDLILFKSVTENALIEIRNLFKSIYRDVHAPIIEMSRVFTPSEIPLSNDKTFWSQVTLQIQPVQDDPVKSPHIAEKPKAKKAAKGKKETKPKAAEINALPLEVKFLLPLSLVQHLAATQVTGGQAPVVDPEHPWTRHMRRSMDGAIVPVKAVVETCRMTVADCTRLEIGQVIDLPGVSLQALGLETDMSGGSVNFGSAALGIYKSHRAVKLIEDMDPEFCSGPLTL